jgi:putative transposase
VNKNAKRRDREQSARRQLPLPLRGLAREALWDTVVISGLAFVEDELEAERVALCGPRYQHLALRQALRSGHVPSSLVFGGRRVKVQRPRARSIDGHEVELPSWRAWSSRDPMDERAFEQMMLGISTRRYARSLEAFPKEIDVRGVGKSAVSERFVVDTQRRLLELMRRDLSELKLVALMIDGAHFAEHVVLAAVGIHRDGEKHVLGLREGATENAASCKALLPDLIERGLNPNRAILVVIDGAKALHKAVVETFGARVLIHRHAPKKSNVIEALPQRMRTSVLSTMNQAYAGCSQETNIARLRRNPAC